ncbi:hypothetical protein BV25DRAFT_1815756, partial [Artomyces pyxidatus]
MHAATLPPEILAHIFVFTAVNEPFRDWDRFTFDLDSEHFPHKKLGWINVTYVCRSWRYAALAYPRLWTHISFALGPRWGKELLSRSKAAPIILDF